ncbi:MAG: adenylate/guanylate cyclase domain-containing protein [Spirochaetia bacterium]|nr:adenylate/guanylate cyclase domain-containing protein [Spirochaetia bacterium]
MSEPSNTNLKKVRRVLQRILINSLNADQVNHLGRDVDPEFDVHRVSGFDSKIVIPKQVAADCVIRFFSSEERLVKFISYMISRAGQGASGGLVHLKGVEPLIEVLREGGWNYDQEKSVFTRETRMTAAEWGTLQEGQDYFLSFASIDVVGSSGLVKSNVKVDVEYTMSLFRAYVQKHVESARGKIWYWHGDGGIAAFYGDNCVPRCVESMVATLAYLPVFNVSENQLNPESDIRLRIGIHCGTAPFHNDASRIESEDLRLAQEIEKHFALAGTIGISETALNLLNEEARRFFRYASEMDFLKIFLYQPD